jgi:hypothetical protein
MSLTPCACEIAERVVGNDRNLQLIKIRQHFERPFLQDVQLALIQELDKVRPLTLSKAILDDIGDRADIEAIGAPVGVFDELGELLPF